MSHKQYNEYQLNKQLDLIQSWLKDTTEPFDSWDWDGKELLIFLNGEVVERYSYKQLKEFIPEL